MRHPLYPRRQDAAVIALGRADHLALVDVATRTVRAYVPVGKRVWHLAISADGRRAYAANGLSDNVSVIDLTTSTVTGTVAVGTAPGASPSHPDLLDETPSRPKG